MFGEILVMCGAFCVGIELKTGRRTAGDGVRFLRVRVRSCLVNGLRRGWGLMDRWMGRITERQDILRDILGVGGSKHT